MWESLIAGGTSLAQGVLNAYQSNANTSRTIRAQKALAEKQFAHDREQSQFAFDKNLEMWRLQNQYNSPEAQMKRFEEAGLSKHMIYGQGTPGNATAMPQYQKAQYQAPQVSHMGRKPVDIASGIQAYSQVRQMNNQSDLLLQQAEKTKAEALKANIQRFILDKSKLNIINKHGYESAEKYYKSEILKYDQLRKQYGIDGADNIIRMIFHDYAVDFQNGDINEDDFRKILYIAQATKVGMKTLRDLMGAGVIGKFISRGRMKTTTSVKSGNVTKSQTTYD